MTDRSRKPGDVILDRYMPKVTEQEREEARAILLAFVSALAVVARRLGGGDKPIRQKADEAIDSGVSMPPV